MFKKRPAGISLWLWITAAALILMLAFNHYYMYYDGMAENVSAGGLLLVLINSRNNLCFAFGYILLLLFGSWSRHAGDCGFGNELGAAASGTAFMILCTVLSCSLVALLYGGSARLTLTETAHMKYTFIGLAVLWLRFFTTAMFILAADRRFSNPAGALMAVLLGVLDFNFYYYTGMETPAHISALEHTLLTFDSIPGIDRIIRKASSIGQPPHWFCRDGCMGNQGGSSEELRAVRCLRARARLWLLRPLSPCFCSLTPEHL